MAQWPYLRWPYLWASDQVFQPTEPIKVLKQRRSQSAENGVNKNAKETELYIDYQTDNENGGGSQDHFSCNAHWAYKGYYLFSGKYQAYMVLPSLQERYGDRLIAHNNQIAWPLSARIERT